MKVLTIVGAPVGVGNPFKEDRPLAYIYFQTTLLSKRRRLVVKPASKEQEAFAREVERRIRDRLENHPELAFIYSARDPENPNARKIAKADDPNLLEAILGYPHLWNEYGDNIVAGYYVLTGYSKIEER